MHSGHNVAVQAQHAPSLHDWHMYNTRAQTVSVSITLGVPYLQYVAQLTALGC